MTRTKIAAAFVLLALAAAGPASAYHMDAIDTGVSVGAIRLTSADWNANGNVIICESLGSLDDRNDAPGPLPGLGGLCTTGENWETGVNAHDRVHGVSSASRPDAGDYVKLDTCDKTFYELVAAAIPPLGEGAGASCQPLTQEQGPLIDEQDAYGWTAEVGAFACFIPTYNFSAQGVADPFSFTEVDWALYYDRLYAWWAYDGDGWHTLGSSIDPADVSNGPPLMATYNLLGWGDDEDGPPNNAGPGNGGGPYDNEDYWHGHVAMFVSVPDSHPPSSGIDLLGSAVTDGPSDGADIVTAIRDLVSGFELSDDDFAELSTPPVENTGGGFWSNSCGASPACPPTPAVVGGSPSRCDAPFGPVFRAPSVDI
jgi:hypothetical protein